MAESKKSPKPVVKTFANDSKLPPLPVPPLRETINKYLQTVIPHATAEELNRTKSFAEEFLKPGGDGERLQLKLQKRSTSLFTFILVCTPIYHLNARLEV
jgi:hypothetical protein